MDVVADEVDSDASTVREPRVENEEHRVVHVHAIESPPPLRPNMEAAAGYDVDNIGSARESRVEDEEHGVGYACGKCAGKTWGCCWLHLCFLRGHRRDLHLQDNV